MARQRNHDSRGRGPGPTQKRDRSISIAITELKSKHSVLGREMGGNKALGPHLVRGIDITPLFKEDEDLLARARCSGRAHIVWQKAVA